MKMAYDDSGRWRQPLILAAALTVGVLASLGLCLGIARMLLGNFPSGTFGLSPPNLSFAMGVGWAVAILTGILTTFVYMAARSDLKWLSLAPAILIPTLAAIGFFFFLLTALST